MAGPRRVQLSQHLIRFFAKLCGLFAQGRVGANTAIGHIVKSGQRIDHCIRHQFVPLAWADVVFPVQIRPVFGQCGKPGRWGSAASEPGGIFCHYRVVRVLTFDGAGGDSFQRGKPRRQQAIQGAQSILKTQYQRVCLLYTSDAADE